VRAHAKPKADFTYKPNDPQIFDTVFFHYTGKGANEWTWYLGTKNALTGSILDPRTTFDETGDKIITLVAKNLSGCTDTMTYTLHVGADSKIFVPNAFTPNGDGDNDSFKAIGYNLKSIHTQIYNRWGELLYESFGLNDAWDGTFKGQLVIEGVYLYMIDAQALDGEHYYLSGDVTVLH
jgi:gliding motility-associated-like protein